MPSTQDPHGSSPIDGVGDPRKGAIGSFSPSKWVVDPAAARALIALGATVIEARGSGQKATRPIQNAAPISWQHFSHEDVPIKGRLLDDDMVLTQRLRALGVSKDVPVVVVDDPKLGGGEAGRLTWTLRTLGHPFTYLVDGGTDALTQSHTLPISLPPLSGDFTVARDLRFQITKDELRNSIDKAGIAFSMYASLGSTPGKRLMARAAAGTFQERSIFSIRPYWIRTVKSCPATKSRASSPKSE
jgi:hypothetical protein